MLRLLVLLLLLANLGYWTWSQGMLTAVGLGPARQGEPERLKDQISASLVRILSPDEVKRLEASLAAQAVKRECLAAGPFNPAEADQLEQRLRALLPVGAYVMSSSVETAQWVVYMGPYANAELVVKKQAELKALGVKSEPIANGALQKGLSLATAPTQQEAQARLQALAPRGVRTARVMLEKPEQTLRMLRLPAVDETQRRRVGEAFSAMPELKPARPC
jgi:hypothetical protein